MADHVYVKSIDRLYDEAVQSVLHNINDRRFCWRHDWVNAHLCVKHEHFFTDLCGHRWQEPELMRNLHQPMRFCSRCKLIDCVHLLRSSVTYRIQKGKYCYTTHTVETCDCCKRRLLTHGSTTFDPSDIGLEIVRAEAAAMGVDLNHCGSGFWCELPQQVSDIADRDVDAARAHARRAMANGVSGVY